MTLEQYLNENYTYDSKTGFMYRNGELLKTRATHANGYLIIRTKFKNKILRGHRVAWFLYYGEWPDTIDHINGIRDDNRITNLRNVSHSENCLNRAKSSHSKTGHSNIIKKGNKYFVSFIKSEKRYLFGPQETIQESIFVREREKKKLGFHKNHGLREPKYSSQLKRY